MVSETALRKSLKLKLQYFGDKSIIVSKTNEDDTLESTASVSGLGFILGAANITEFSETHIVLTKVRHQNLTATITESNDVINVGFGETVVFVSGTLGVSEENDVISECLARVGSSVLGTGAVTEDSDTVSASAVSTITASMTSQSIVPGRLVTYTEGPVGSFADNTAPYSLPTTFVPAENSLMLLAISQTLPNGGNVSIADTSGGVLTWTKHIDIDSTNSPTGDTLKTTLWSARTNSNPGSVTVRIECDDVMGASVWKFLFIQDENETTPFRQISPTYTSGTPADNQTGVALTFTNNTYSNSVVFGFASIMGDSVNLVDADMDNGDWAYVREFERISEISETDSSTYQLLTFNESRAGNALFSFNNIEGVGYRDGHAVFFEIQPALVYADDDYLDAQVFGSSNGIVSYTEENDIVSVGGGLNNTLFTADMEDQPLGEVTSADLSTYWNWRENWASGIDVVPAKVFIVNDPTDINNKVLECNYFEGTRGHMIWQIDLGGIYNDVTLEYRVRMPGGTVLQRGGKYPGLAGGTAPTGGENSADGLGFTTRFNWVEQGSSTDICNISLYLYDMDKPNGSTGDHWRLSEIDPIRTRAEENTTWGDQYVWATDRLTGIPEYGWRTLKQRIVMNSVVGGTAQTDGEFYAWIDDVLVGQCTNARFRSSEALGIDMLYFSTFYGGGDSADYQTVKDEIFYFDDFVVTLNS